MTHLCRAVRLVRIMEMLKDRCYETGELADHFRVSRRTIQRDLYDLTGEPLYYPAVERHIWQHMDLPCREPG